MFEIGELAHFRLGNGVEIKGSVLAIPERTELGINLAAAIHLDLCNLWSQPRRDRVFLQPLPNLKQDVYKRQVSRYQIVGEIVFRS